MAVMTIKNLWTPSVLKQRIITAVLLLLALIAATTQLPSFYFSVLIALIILIAAYEWAGLISPQHKTTKLPYILSVGSMLLGGFFLLGVSPDAQSIDI